MGDGNGSDDGVCLLLAFLNLTKEFLNNFYFFYKRIQIESKKNIKKKKK